MLRLHWGCPDKLLAWDDLVVEAVALSTPSPTWSSVATATNTIHPTSTVSPTGTRTSTWTVAPTVTSSITPTRTATPTITPTVMPGGSCFQPHAGSGCDDKECEAKVCVADFSCCGGGSSPRGWDQSCVNAANYFCKPTRVPTATTTSSATATSTPTATLLPTSSPTATVTETPFQVSWCSLAPLPHCASFDYASLRVRSTRIGTKTLWKGSRYGGGEYQSFGDPLSSTRYAICLYHGEFSSLILDKAVESGLGWRSRGSGFSYSSDFDQKRLGISLVRHTFLDHFLVRLNDRENRVEIDSTAPLIFQIQNSEGMCWSSTFQPPFRVSSSSKTSVRCETRKSPCSL